MFFVTSSIIYFFTHTHTISQQIVRDRTESEGDARDQFDSLEVFEMLRHLNDPEHPLTLEQLNVVRLEDIEVDDRKCKVCVNYTPTIPHCSMATVIGLCIRVKLLRSLPSRFKVDVRIAKDTHSQEKAVNKQLNDKERVAAALENSHLLSVVNKCISNTDRSPLPDISQDFNKADDDLV